MDAAKKKILLTVDGSGQSLNAVRYVSKMLNPENTEIVLFHVMRKIQDAFRNIGSSAAFLSRVKEISALETKQRMIIQKFMDESRQILLDADFDEASVRIKIHECEVGVARDIIKESNNGYRAVVVGRRGQSKLADLVMGSVACKLAERLSRVPIWIVGGTPWVGKILLGLDPSEGAIRAVDHVGTMLGGSEFEVSLVNVLRTKGFFVPEIDELPAHEQQDFIAQAKVEIDPVFLTAQNLLVKAGFDIKQISTKLITGVASRAGAIVDEARHGGYGTIVIGRRGISKVEEFFMGRVSSKVINLAKDLSVWVVS